MLQQDSPKTGNYNISVKKLIAQEARLQIESEIIYEQLQKFETLAHANSQTTTETFRNSPCFKTRALLDKNIISDVYDLRKVHLVAAIHIGAPFTELAFSMTLDPKPITIFSWRGGTTERDKTNVLIKADGKTVEAFGDEAEQMYSNLVSKNTHKERYMFRDFMLKLYSKEKIIEKDTKLEDADGKTLNALNVVSTTIRQIQYKFITRLKAKFDDSRFDEKDIYWVLTFPPWHKSAETFMIMAALQAGIDRNHLSVVNEIEAIVCFFPQFDFRSKENRILTVPTGTRHIVCDAGAEKVGIAVIDVSSENKINLVQAEFISGCRGEMINEAFQNIFDSLAGFEIMKLLKENYVNDFNEIEKNIEVIKKETKLPVIYSVYFTLPVMFSTKVQERCRRSLKEHIRNSVYKNDEFQYVDDNILLISRLIVKNIFNEPLQKIIDCLSTVSSSMGCSLIFTVGEFSEMPYFHHALRQAFPKMPIRRALGENAVLTGAVLFGHFVCEKMICDYETDQVCETLIYDRQWRNTKH